MFLTVLFLVLFYGGNSALAVPISNRVIQGIQENVNSLGDYTKCNANMYIFDVPGPNQPFNVYTGGGIIISPQAVLTSCRLFVKPDGSRFTAVAVALGVTDFYVAANNAETVQQRSCDNTLSFVHADYNYITFENDVCICRFTAPLDLIKNGVPIAAVARLAKTDDDCEKGTVQGNGYLETNIPSEQLVQYNSTIPYVTAGIQVVDQTPLSRYVHWYDVVSDPTVTLVNPFHYGLCKSKIEDPMKQMCVVPRNDNLLNFNSARGLGSIGDIGGGFLQNYGTKVNEDTFVTCGILSQILGPSENTPNAEADGSRNVRVYANILTNVVPYRDVILSNAGDGAITY